MKTASKRVRAERIHSSKAGGHKQRPLENAGRAPGFRGDARGPAPPELSSSPCRPRSCLRPKAGRGGAHKLPSPFHFLQQHVLTRAPAVGRVVFWKTRFSLALCGGHFWGSAVLARLSHVVCGGPGPRPAWRPPNPDVARTVLAPGCSAPVSPPRGCRRVVHVQGGPAWFPLPHVPAASVTAEGSDDPGRPGSARACCSPGSPESSVRVRVRSRE